MLIRVVFVQGMEAWWLSMGGSSQEDLWEAENFPDTLRQGWSLSCRWDVHLAQKVREGWVK